MASWQGPPRRGYGGYRHQGGGGRGGGGGGGGGDFRGGSKVFSPSGGVPNPDSKVTELENIFVDNKNLSLTDPSLNQEFPRRPSYGTNGKPVHLWVNYYRLRGPPTLVLYYYDLTVKPEACGGKLGQIVRLLLQSPALNSHQQHIVTDFKAILVSSNKIENQIVDITYRAEDEDEPRQGARQYKVKIELKHTLPLADLAGYLRSADQTQYVGKLPAIQALNILINYYAKSSDTIKAIGPSKNYSLVNAESQNLDHGLVALRGFFTSVRAATGRILLNVNVCHSVFYEAIPLDGLMNTRRTYSLFKLATFLERLKVRTTHLKQKKRKDGTIVIRPKTIYNLATTEDGTRRDGERITHPPVVQRHGAGAKEVQFWFEDQGKKIIPVSKKKKKGEPPSSGGYYISVYDYFQKTYGIQIKDPKMPVVNVGTLENPSYLPAQVCIVLPGQPATKTRLSPFQTKKMIDFAVRTPAANATSIVSKGMDNVGLNLDTFAQLKHFGVSVDPGLITVSGRVLSAPEIYYKGSKRAQVKDGSWNMLHVQFSTPTYLQSWACLYIDMPPAMYPEAHKFDQKQLIELTEAFGQVMMKEGMRVNKPQSHIRVPLRSTEDPQLDKAIESLATKVQLILIVLPHSPIPEYYRIKQLGDVKYGVHTVCTVGSKLARKDDQYLRNVSLKINLKLGGENQIVPPQCLGILAQKKTMVVGMDVTHPSPGSSKTARSRAAMVANISPRLTQWPGVTATQEGGREMIAEIGSMLKSRLKLWHQNNRAYPENIVVCRDGVSEGQKKTVLEQELTQLRAACREMYPALDTAKGFPRFTILIVGKRHHTRFYATSVDNADRSGNPKAGTVVDRGVTEARNHDFFLQPHAAIKGTARSAHYDVIFDEVFPATTVSGKNMADEVQMLMHSLSYIYNRATKAVSYCAPAYYAHILCERERVLNYKEYETPSNSVAPSVAGSTAQDDDEMRIHDRLKDTMFYM